MTFSVHSLSSSSGAQLVMDPTQLQEIQKNIDTRFKELSIPQNDQDYLHSRFKDESQKLLDLLNCLDTSALNEVNSQNANENISKNFQPVDGVRLGRILVETAKYDCGKQQLIQLTDELKTEGIKLKIIEPITEIQGQDAYAFMSTYSLMNKQNPVIYISVQPKNPIPGKRCVGKYDAKTRKFNKIKSWSEDEIFKDNKDRLEGYKFGHEVSHAITFIKFYKKIKNSLGENAVYSKWSGNHQGWSSDENKKIFNDKTDIYWNLFETPEEYRNLLGLGIDKTFGDKDKNIIGEFDYLNEVMNNDKDAIYVRVPYNSDYTLKSNEIEIVENICQQKHEQLYGSSGSASCGCLPSNCILC